MSGTAQYGWVFRAIERFAASGIVADHGYNPNSGTYVAAEIDGRHRTFTSMGAVNRYFNGR